MFGIGQKVRVKDFSELAGKYGITDGGIVIGDYMFEKAMKVYCGEEYRVLSHFEDNTYELDTNDNENWVFHEEVLELPNYKKVENNLKQENILLKAELEKANNRIKELEEYNEKYPYRYSEQYLEENKFLKEENEKLKAQLKAEIKPITDEIQDDIIDDIKPKKRAYNRKQKV